MCSCSELLCFLIYFMRLCCTFYLYFVYFDSSAMIPPPFDELMLDLNPYDVCALVSLQKENICIRN